MWRDYRRSNGMKSFSSEVSSSSYIIERKKFFHQSYHARFSTPYVCNYDDDVVEQESRQSGMWKHTRKKLMIYVFWWFQSLFFWFWLLSFQSWRDRLDSRDGRKIINSRLWLRWKKEVKLKSRGCNHILHFKLV